MMIDVVIAAKLAGVSESRIRTEIRKGRLVSEQWGFGLRNAVLVSTEDLSRWLAEFSKTGKGAREIEQVKNAVVAARGAVEAAEAEMAAEETSGHQSTPE